MIAETGTFKMHTKSSEKSSQQHTCVQGKCFLPPVILISKIKVNFKESKQKYQSHASSGEKQNKTNPKQLFLTLKSLFKNFCKKIKQKKKEENTVKLWIRFIQAKQVNMSMK